MQGLAVWFAASCTSLSTFWFACQRHQFCAPNFSRKVSQGMWELTHVVWTRSACSRISRKRSSDFQPCFLATVCGTPLQSSVTSTAPTVLRATYSSAAASARKTVCSPVTGPVARPTTWMALSPLMKAMTPQVSTWNLVSWEPPGLPSVAKKRFSYAGENFTLHARAPPPTHPRANVRSISRLVRLSAQVRAHANAMRHENMLKLKDCEIEFLANAKKRRSGIRH